MTFQAIFGGLGVLPLSGLGLNVPLNPQKEQGRKRITKINSERISDKSEILRK